MRNTSLLVTAPFQIFCVGDRDPQWKWLYLVLSDARVWIRRAPAYSGRSLASHLAGSHSLRELRIQADVGGTIAEKPGHRFRSLEKWLLVLFPPDIPYELLKDTSSSVLLGMCPKMVWEFTNISYCINVVFLSLVTKEERVGDKIFLTRRNFLLPFLSLLTWCKLRLQRVDNSLNHDNRLILLLEKLIQRAHQPRVLWLTPYLNRMIETSFNILLSNFPKIWSPFVKSGENILLASFLVISP